ncbi:hypothetical protein [Halorubrum ezzemoulense]|uniref:hypothetical protein n=1 Tax=Halorubrum ezzemoulense TaxID=337243 RepID=UPI00232EDEF8|nr:hypothetical protein [Halorubrum ezzemoulense]MDB2240927.1 hypothetical protein [Halorubrum ezzemoulense]
MTRDHRWTRRAALGFLGAGFGLAAISTDAATRVHSDRAVELTTTTDSTALLPLEEESPFTPISRQNPSTVIYTILASESDTEYTFSELSVTVTDVLDSSGTSITTEAVETSLDETGSGDYAVTLACADSAGGFSGEYYVTLALVADTESFSVDATRTTGEAVSITCPIDYGNANNYSDDAAGEAARPGDAATGTVVGSQNVNNGDNTSSADLKGSGGNGLYVGFKLPPVPSATTYALEIEASETTGNLIAYLVDGSGDRVIFVDENGTELSSEFVLKNRNRPFEFTVEPENDISNSELFLIFEGGTSGQNASKLEGFSFEPSE